MFLQYKKEQSIIGGSATRMNTENADMERLHKRNAARLDQIINAIGYPTKSKVGEEASEAAWLIIQHAISEPVFMKKCFALLSASAGDVNPSNIAYMYDRICYLEEGRRSKVRSLIILVYILLKMWT